MTPCLEAEVLAAYLDHGVSLAERARVDAHLASCPQCVAVLAGVARTVADLSAHLPAADVTAEATPWMTGRAWAGALGAAAAVIAVLLMPTVVRHQGNRDAGLVSLVGTVGEQRSVLGRLTGGFPHAPLGRPSAGGQDGQAAGNDRVQLTAGRIRESVGEHMTPAELHTLGVSQLLAGKYDDAAMSLLAASREQPANAQYLSDVAAVQLERGRRGLRPDDLPRALASADRALRLDPSLAEAWFNRALTLTSLSLRDEAARTWADYLRKDSNSAWAAEAKSRLADLNKQTVAQQWPATELALKNVVDAETAESAVRLQSTEARTFIEQTLLAKWTAAVSEGRSGTPELDELRIMSQAMLRISGDAMYADVVAAIDRTPPAELKSAVAAYQEYLEAAALYQDDKYAASEPGLRAALKSLSAIGSPFIARVRIDIATLDYVTGRYDVLERDMTAQLTAARASRYSFVAGRASWMLGLVAFVQGKHGDALAHYEDALAEFDRLGDAEQAAAAHNLMASLFHYIGDESAAWEHTIAALRGLEVTRSLRLRHGLLINTALTVRTISEEAALAIQDEVIRNANQWGREAAIAEAYAQRASILAGLNRGLEASRDLQQARKQIAASNDPAMKPRVEMILLGAEADLFKRTNPPAAIDAAQRAIALATSRRDRLRVAQLQLRVAQANLALGRKPEAREALLAGIASFDAERQSLSDEGRLLSRDESWGLFETSVELAIKENDLEKAFALSERARVRSLAETNALPAAPSLAAVRSSLAADEAIVALNQFDDSLAIWIIQHDGASVISRAIARGETQRLVARQQDEVRLGGAVPYASRDLFNEVIRPVLAQLNGVSRLVVVPDPEFQDVHFAALWNESAQRFLIEQFSLRLAPAASAHAVDRAPIAVNGSALAVGVTDRGTDDARTVAALYRSSSTLLGDAATGPQIAADATRVSIVHFAAPVIESRANPLLSRLQMADDGARHAGMITGTDVVKWQLSKTQLVVLDNVGNAVSHKGDGTLGMARAFLTAGAPVVIGTLPGSNNVDIRELMIAFHREIAQGMSAEQALQKVQRSAIQKNGRRFGAWSALVMYGSDR